MVQVSVIVPHYNDLASLSICLDALNGQTLPRDAFEIVVADNASPCGLDAVRQTAADRARVVLAAVPGAGPARNAGVIAASGTVFAFTDSDCVPDPGWLAAGIAALDRHDVVGGRMTVAIDTPPPRTGAQLFELLFAFDNKRYVEHEGFSVTANLFCRRDVFESVGDFRSGVAEDKEWCARATGKGFRLGYADGAVVAHPARRDWTALKDKWRRLNAEGLALAAERSARPLGWLARQWLLPASVVAHAPRILTSPTLAGPAERLRALATLGRLRLWRLWDAHRQFLARR